MVISKSIHWLNRGINGQKVNFSNSEIKNVIIKLSADGKFLMWQKREGDRSIIDKVMGYSKIELSQVVGIVYGGATTTFESVIKKIIRAHAVLRPTR